LLPQFMGSCHSDYLGADNAGLHALLLRRTKFDGEEEMKGAELDFRAIRNLSVVKDLHGVVAWVEKNNTTYQEQCGV
jgi:hypothetical protein